MTSDQRAEVTALAINVTIPEALRWADTRRGATFTLTTLNVRLLADSHLAARAYGRPAAGGRGAYVSFAVPDNPALAALITEAATPGRLALGRSPRAPLTAPTGTPRPHRRRNPGSPGTSIGRALPHTRSGISGRLLPQRQCISMRSWRAVASAASDNVCPVPLG